MVRFGQAFINSLTNPSYGQGLFTAAQQFGSAPAVAKERQRQTDLIKGMLTQSPIQQARTLQEEAIKKGDLKGALQAKQMEDKTLQSGAMQGINALISQIANPQTSQEMVNRSKQTITQLARNNQVDEYTVMSRVTAAEKARKDAVTNSGNVVADRLRIAIKQAPTLEDAKKIENRLIQISNNPNDVGLSEKTFRDRANIQEENQEAAASIATDRQLSIIQTSTDPEEIMQAQREIIKIGNTYGTPYSEYADAAQKRIKQINDSNWEINQRTNTQRKSQEQAIVDSLSNQAEMQQNPIAFIDANIPEELAYLRDDVIKETNTRIAAADSLNKVSESGELSNEDFKFLKNNPDLIESTPGLKAAYKLYTAGKATPSQLRSAAMSLTKAVSSEKQRRRKLETSDSFAKENADNAINFILGATQPVTIADQSGNLRTVTLPSGTGMFEDPDLYDVVKDTVEDEKLSSEFRNRVANVYKLNPSVNPMDAARKALDDMNIDYSGEELTQKRREDLIQQATQVDAAIQSWYKENDITNPTPKDRAMAELAVREELQSIIEQEREARMGRVQELRSSTPSRGQLSVF